jgi:hypothetical protein
MMGDVGSGSCGVGFVRAAKKEVLIKITIQPAEKETLYERRFREAREGGGNRGLVDLADPRRGSSVSVDFIPAGHVGSSCIAVVLMGPGHNLAFHPDRVVLGYNDNESMHLAPSIGCSLANVMGKAVKKTNGWLKSGLSKEFWNRTTAGIGNPRIE